MYCHGYCCGTNEYSCRHADGPRYSSIHPITHLLTPYHTPSYTSFSVLTSTYHPLSPMLPRGHFGGRHYPHLSNELRYCRSVFVGSHQQHQRGCDRSDCVFSSTLGSRRQCGLHGLCSHHHRLFNHHLPQQQCC